ncbi:MAG: response regulator, partial [Spirochaetales bacterium]|nr:response regulator [Spirochaetales bacterium]
INDILDISKVEAGQLKMEDIDFNVVDVIERTVDLISMEGHKKGLEINIDISPSIPVMLRGDPGRLRQVILNLVKNAVKFTESGGLLLKVRIHTHENGVSLDGTTLQYLQFEIQDTGIGIPKEAQQKLFTQFFQADASTTRRFGGTGLGLAISKNIVSLMGGEIGVKDNEPTGCTFWFTMPLRPSAIQPPGELLPLNSETRFLLVDDNPQTIKILTGMLISLGYTHVLAALSGKEALETLQTARAQGKSFDIVFIDMVMPEMDGWRLAAEINKDRAINDAQLYLMVPEGSFGADAKMKLLEWFNGYLYKPIKQHLLMDLLKEHYQSSIDLEVIDELEPVDEEEPTIPARQTSAAKEELPIDKPTTPPLAKGLTILVAEDHPVNRKLLTILLEKAGATVVGAADGKEAIEQAEKHTFDLVFMDIQMPRMNGYEASRWMREHNIYTPIIACTASAQENERENCLECGMTDVLPKPYKKQDVFTLIGTYAKAQTEDDPSIFDPQLMFEIMMGDLESAKTLLQEFLEQTTAHIAIVREDIEKADMQSARKSAHLIKGSALNVTAKRLAEAARLIEEAPEGESTATLLSHVESLTTEYHRLTTYLDTTGYLAGNKGHP